MKIVQSVSAETLAWLPHCTVIQCCDGGRFSVNDDHENFITAYRNTNQFDIAYNIEARYGEPVPDLDSGTSDSESVESNESSNPYDGNPGAPVPESDNAESDTRSFPGLKSFDEVKDLIQPDQSESAMLDSLRNELKSTNEKSMLLASRLVKMERACDINKNSELIAKIQSQAMGHYFVYGFGFDRDDIVIVTDRLVARHGDERFDLGQIEIRFKTKSFLSGVISDPRFFNLSHDTRNTDGQAGHVDHDGSPCLGGWLVPLAQFAQDYNISGVIDQFIGFLTQPDPDDGMGCYILSFPRL